MSDEKYMPCLIQYRCDMKDNLHYISFKSPTSLGINIPIGSLAECRPFRGSLLGSEEIDNLIEFLLKLKR